MAHGSPSNRKRKASGSRPKTLRSPHGPGQKRQRTSPLLVTDLADSSDSADEVCCEEDLNLELDSTDPGPEDMPVRRLDVFCIYDEDGDYASATDLLGPMSNRHFTASGLARAHHVKDFDDADDDFAQPVEHLEIIGFNIHHVTETGELDRKIYIQTARAFYILESPAPVYKPFFTPLWIRHQFTHLVVSSALRTPSITYENFVDSLRNPLTEYQLKSHDIIDYLLPCLETIAFDLERTRRHKIKTVPLIKTLTSRKFAQQLARWDLPARPVGETFVTPIVAGVVLSHLNRAMSVVGTQLADSDMNTVLLEQPANTLFEHARPDTLRWGSSFNSPGYYDSVTMDGSTYRIGDIVSVNPGEDEDTERAVHGATAARFCVNAYAKRVWFIQIQYFFDDETERDSLGRPSKKLHGVWLVHGSVTILQEAAHSQELFFLEECSNIDVSSILRKCDVLRLRPGQAEPKDSRDASATAYFYQLVWDPEECELRDLPSDYDEAQQHLRVSTCIICMLMLDNDWRGTPIPLGDPLNGFSQLGSDFHVGDFVYVKPLTGAQAEDKPAQPLVVGQIIDINFPLEGEDELEQDLICSMRYFKRYTEDWMAFKDDRRLYRSRHSNEVRSRDIDGICFVKYIDEADSQAIQSWIKGDGGSPDRFYTCTRQNTAGQLVKIDGAEFEHDLCHLCTEKHIQENRRYHLANSRLATLDVFSGAGGLSAGMISTAFVETKWAIEQSASAAQTFKANHQEAHVLCADVNAVLKYIVEREEGKAPPPLGSSIGFIIPDGNIPRRGEVDVVMGGPPCQSFSGANHIKKKDDIRSTLPYTMLGLVEALEPKYFLLENVTGFLYHSLTTNTGQRINMAAVKLVQRSLTALGYQVCIKILQAGQYGAPQSRERVIIIGTKRGHEMPKWPVPTHAFPPAMQRRIPMRQRDRLRPPARPTRDEEDRVYTAHPAVTVNDAIDDLPAFEWVNPHWHFPQTPEDFSEQCRREQAGIPQFSVSKEPVGFTEPVSFLTEPRTRYQQMLRRQDGLVEHHVTESFSELVVESTTLVPLKPWATHLFLPKEILPKMMKIPGDTKAHYYGRLDGAAYFKTAMTAPKPYQDKAYFIHPSQKRSLTLREFARSQGFPDDYVFCSTETTPAKRLQEYFKLVGNAVPLPLAAALGRSIGAAAIEEWRERRRRGASVEC